MTIKQAASIAGQAIGQAQDNFIARIGKTPTTNLSSVAATWMICVTGVAYLAAMFLEKHPEPVTFGIWCGLMAGWKGIAVKQFNVKRTTDIDFVRAQQGLAPEPNAPPS